MYRCDNDTIVAVDYNCSSVAAPVCHRTGEMVISLADDSSCCPQKVCGGSTRKQVLDKLKENLRSDGATFGCAVCNQSLCHLLPPACKYGEKWVSYYRPDSCCPDYVCGEAFTATKIN